MNKDIIGKVLEVSDSLGFRRSTEFVAIKLQEELGEFAVEIGIAKEMLPVHKGGDDGVLGEACDVINCVVDYTYLVMKQRNPSITKEDIFRLMAKTQEKKCEKWVKVALDKK